MTAHGQSVLTTFAQLAEAAKRPDVRRHSEELEMDIFVRHMSASERDTYENSFLTKGEVDTSKLRGVRQRLVELGLSDGEGNKISKQTDLDKLPSAVIDELARIVGEVNGLNVTSKDEAGNDSGKTAD